MIIGATLGSLAVLLVLAFIVVIATMIIFTNKRQKTVTITDGQPQGSISMENKYHVSDRLEIVSVQN